MESGVPQDSIQGPILFSIYMSDLSSVFRHCLSESYVDDTQSSISSEFIIGTSIIVFFWTQKRQLMLPGSRQILSNLPEVRLSLSWNDPIPAKAVKDLSVTSDPNLTFDDHILKTVSSCMLSLAQILPSNSVNCFIVHPFCKMQQLHIYLSFRLYRTSPPGSSATPRSSTM